MNKQKIIGAIIGIVLFIAMIAGITYAAINWTSGNINGKVSSKCFDVFYEKGADLVGNLVPSNDYTGGLFTTVKMNINAACNIDAKGIIYLKTENDTSSNLYREGLLNYTVLRNENTVIASGNITSAGEIAIDVGKLARAQYGTTRYQIYVWLNNDLVQNSDINSVYYGSVRSVALQEDGEYDDNYNEIPVTDLSNFTYYLGSEYSTVDSISYYDEETDAYYDIPVIPMTLDEDEVLLTRYNGSATDVNVPDTYTVDGKTYKVTMLSNFINYDNDYGLTVDSGVFIHNENITSVLLGQNIKVIYSFEDLYVNDASFLFFECTSLVSVPVIPSSVTVIVDIFGFCTSLVSAPAIPSSVTDMSYAFEGCTSLINVPEIPSSVISMQGTFFECTSLVNAPKISSSVINLIETFAQCTSLVNTPEIPSSVIDMTAAFEGCTSLINAPEIPSSVEIMEGTFANCTNLTGIVSINSLNVSSVVAIFYNTSKDIIVEVPAGSTTYDTFDNADSDSMPANVKLDTFE